jgi:hypothetical protein
MSFWVNPQAPKLFYGPRPEEDGYVEIDASSQEIEAIALREISEIREGPSLDAQILGTWPAGKVVRIVGTVENGAWGVIPFPYFRASTAVIHWVFFRYSREEPYLTDQNLFQARLKRFERETKGCYK